MLNKLKKFGQAHYDFCEYELKSIDKSCYLNESCKVIDFDKVKAKVVALHNLQTTSSCDGLKICTDENTIDFIEMKGFEEFKRNNQVSDKTIKKQTKKFDFEKKLEDSYYLIQTIMKSPSFGATKKEYREFKSVKKRYFILTDLRLETNALESILYGFNFLAETSNIDKTIEICLQEKVDGINICYLSEKPRLVSCEQICNILCKSEMIND